MPLYIIEEFIIRLQAFNKGIGVLKSYIRLGEQMIIKTNRGMITVPIALLSYQLQTPYAITSNEIEALSRQFIRARKPGKALNTM